MARSLSSLSGRFLRGSSLVVCSSSFQSLVWKSQSLVGSNALCRKELASQHFCFMRHFVRQGRGRGKNSGCCGVQRKWISSRNEHCLWVDFIQQQSGIDLTLAQLMQRSLTEIAACHLWKSMVQVSSASTLQCSHTTGRQPRMGSRYSPALLTACKILCYKAATEAFGILCSETQDPFQAWLAWRSTLSSVHWCSAEQRHGICEHLSKTCSCQTFTCSGSCSLSGIALIVKGTVKNKDSCKFSFDEQNPSTNTSGLLVKS